MTQDDLEYWTERAAIREHDGGMSRAEAERMATDDLWAHQEAKRVERGRGWRAKR